MRFYESGDTCPKTCDNLLVIGKCQQDPVDGCFCPPDQFWDKAIRRCVNQSQCSCYRDNVHYPHGAVRPGRCEEW